MIMLDTVVPTDQAACIHRLQPPIANGTELNLTQTQPNAAKRGVLLILTSNFVQTPNALLSSHFVWHQFEFVAKTLPQ